MADGRHHENRYDVITLPIPMKFGTLMENQMSMTVKRSKSKPEVEFQYGGCLFSETGSSNTSAVD